LEALKKKDWQAQTSHLLRAFCGYQSFSGISYQKGNSQTLPWWDTGNGSWRVKIYGCTWGVTGMAYSPMIIIMVKGPEPSPYAGVMALWNLLTCRKGRWTGLLWTLRWHGMVQRDGSAQLSITPWLHLLLQSVT
jgi:hypothetical protein